MVELEVRTSTLNFPSRNPTQTRDLDQLSKRTSIWLGLVCFCMLVSCDSTLCYKQCHTIMVFWCSVCDRLVCNETDVCVSFLYFPFFFFLQPAIVNFVNCEQCIRALFMVPQITIFSNFFIKNGFHSIIYTFKNYFATVFSVSAKISSIQTHPI